MQDDSLATGHAETPTYDPDGDAQEFWEKIYERAGQTWMGRVSAELVEFASELRPGRALDLGCGTGGDAIWLAQQGWQVLAADVSASALKLAAGRAQQLRVDTLIEFQRCDLSDRFPSGSFDLVSAQYLHSPVRLHRVAILRQAAAAVRPGGALLIVDHGSAAPWSWKIPGHRFVPPRELLDSLRLPEGRWLPIRVGSVERQATGPEGQTATVTDNVVALRRKEN